VPWDVRERGTSDNRSPAIFPGKILKPFLAMHPQKNSSRLCFFLLTLYLATDHRLHASEIFLCRAESEPDAISGLKMGESRS
jgi:hypothetical protein